MQLHHHHILAGAERATLRFARALPSEPKQRIGGIAIGVDCEIDPRRQQLAHGGGLQGGHSRRVPLAIESSGDSQPGRCRNGEEPAGSLRGDVLAAANPPQNIPPMAHEPGHHKLRRAN